MRKNRDLDINMHNSWEKDDWAISIYNYYVRDWEVTWYKDSHESVKDIVNDYVNSQLGWCLLKTFLECGNNYNI